MSHVLLWIGALPSAEPTLVTTKPEEQPEANKIDHPTKPPSGGGDIIPPQLIPTKPSAHEHSPVGAVVVDGEQSVKTLKPGIKLEPVSEIGQHVVVI